MTILRAFIANVQNVTSCGVCVTVTVFKMLCTFKIQREALIPLGVQATPKSIPLPLAIYIYNILRNIDHLHITVQYLRFLSFNYEDIILVNYRSMTINFFYGEVHKLFCDFIPLIFSVEKNT
jgi:hypothetical protein